MRSRARLVMSLWVLLMLATACEPARVQVIPTQQPSAVPTVTGTTERSPQRALTPSPTVTRATVQPTGGPSPTALLGPSRTPPPDAAATDTPSGPRSPNAPRIEFFTSDLLAVEPGGEVNLYWSARNADAAVIYRLNARNERTQVWNVAPDGSLPVQTRASDRGELRFVISVGETEDYTELTLAIPLECPIIWFFDPAPDACPNEAPEESLMIEQPFERGRMLFVESRNIVYALFNDGSRPAWLAVENRYDPAIHAESEPDFVPPAGLVQPIRELGLLWRANDLVRNRLGLGLQEPSTYQGFAQTAANASATDDLYLSSGDGQVLLIVPGGDQWQIIGP